MFVRFLKDQGAYTKFVKNFKKASSEATRRAWVATTNYCSWEQLPLEILLSFAFIWNETDEGDKYWRDLDAKWKQTIPNF